MITAEAEMERALRALGHLPGAAERAMARTLNGAGVSARAAAIERMTSRYAVRPEDVRRLLGLSTATPSKLEVAVSARSGSTSLGYFPHAPNLPGTGGRGRPPLRAEVLRGQPRQVAGAFVADVNSGRRIFKRVPGRTASGKQKLEALRTVPLAVMLGVESVRLEVERTALATVEARLDQEIGRELEKSA